MSKDYKKASAWFEDLYKENYKKNENIPWAQMRANEHLVDYLKQNSSRGKALVVGCGLGDDAMMLREAGFDVTAIDISDSAIKWCKERFEGSEIDFVVQDIFELPKSMIGSYDFVFEALTIQSLPLEFREKIITAISSLVNENGKILVVAHAKDKDSTLQGPPWPLVKDEIKLFSKKGLKEIEFNIVKEPTKISSSKFKAVFQKS